MSVTTREDVARLVMRARREDDITQAEREMRKWLEGHPQDRDYLLLAGEQMEMIKSAVDASPGDAPSR